MDLKLVWLFLSVLTTATTNTAPRSGSSRNLCYAEDKRPQRCFPPFVNAAFNVPVEATNTCGHDGPEDFCQQTGAAGATKSCDVCDSYDPAKSHPARYLTDFHSVDNLTWWQSSTMLEDVQWPRSVNLTINLGKAFEITYVRLKFFSSRPESFAIYRRKSENSDWTPFQFYSASCEGTYNMSSVAIITADGEGEAVCRDEFSDISPLTGGSVAFSTLEGRPRAYDFENSPVLQDWVTATDIRIVLNRINTFRDEVFGDPNVLRSYFYAISDFAIGGRCKCNGHASECVRSEERGGRLTCNCQHFTDGPDCERCLPFYNDIPWRRAIAGHVVECKPCNCNGRSQHCYFDQVLFDHTGHGGHCLDCDGYTDGPNCERCREAFYRFSEEDSCQPCSCHPLGSLSQQCDVYGRCSCKLGVTGDKCNQCQPEYYHLNESGCSACNCLKAGSFHNQPHCDSRSGDCLCKEYVEGQRCDRCKAGYFNLQEDDALGCMPCFCYGHSTECTLSSRYSLNDIRSQFYEGTERWMGVTRGGSEVPVDHVASTREISIAFEDSDIVYFVLPDEYLGDLRFSYNQLLTFKLRFEGDEPRPSIADFVIEGNGYQVMAPIFAQGNQMPGRDTQSFAFRLREHVSYHWTPRLTSLEFVRMLSNVTSIKIRGTYSSQGVGYLSEVSLSSAVQRSSSGESYGAVEQCTCPEGYVGQFCESCGPGYHRDPPHGGPYSLCIPCSCNGHSEDCDLNTGRCICDHNTTGENCERCLDGFYGVATTGTLDDCHQCPCPEGARCLQVLSGDVACFDCPGGQTGRRCESCDSGYYGDPSGRLGDPRPCSLCSCNNNIDPNAVGNCNSTTGECLKCIYNTGGHECERCLPGYYGDALSLPHGDCQACECFPLGSRYNGDFWEREGQQVVSCDNVTGLCPCLPNVIGQRCDQCLEGYWNIVSGSGCETCNCDMMGSVNGSCEQSSGQCHCKEGVTGLKCDQCLPNSFNFTIDGCIRCNCDPDGSLSLQCEITTGQCPCRPNVIGRHCDSCALNKYNITAGCIDCPSCYEIVKESYEAASGNLKDLAQIVEAIRTAPSEALNDTDFLQRIADVNGTVYQLWIDAKNSNEGSLAAGYETILSSIEDVLTMSSDASFEIAEARRHIHNAGVDIAEAENALNETDAELKDSESYLGEDGMAALQSAIDTHERLGQQSENMTLMAKEARLIAERLEAEINHVTETADKALNTSREALALIGEVLTKPDLLAVELQQLEAQVNGTRRLYEETKGLADETGVIAKAVYNESNVIYTEVASLESPDADIDSMKQEISTINQTAVGLIEDVDRLLAEEQEWTGKISALKTNATVLLAEGRLTQDALQDLMTEALTTKTKATEAVNKTNIILAEAQQTLRTLQEFDERVQQSKRESMVAMDKIPSIQESIADAENLTKLAFDKLDNAEADAAAALELAQMALNISLRVTQEIVEVMEETSLSRQHSEQLTVEASELVVNITELEERIQNLEEQAEDDRLLIAETLVKAKDSKTVAEGASEKVVDALNEVSRLLVNIEGQSSVDTHVLDFMEQYLDSAENHLVDAQLEGRFQSLVEMKMQMDNWLATYDQEMLQLSSDVENIRQINETLPRSCFKKISLEPTDN